MKDFKEIYAELTETQANANDEFTKAKVKVMQSNAVIAFKFQVFPKILEILNKYAGKRIGDKTNKKIQNEIQSVTGCYVAFNQMRNIDIWTNYYNLPDRRITMYSVYGETNFIEEDGKLKLKKLDVNMYIMPKEEEYIENVEEYVNRKMKEVAEINEKLKELRDMVTAYNEDLTEGFDRLSTYNFNINGIKLL